MTAYSKNIRAVLLFAGIAGIICLAAVLAKPSYAQLNNQPVRSVRDLWLSQYEGQNMRVTFVTVPTYLGTDLQKTSALKIVEASDAGIVVNFRPSRTVFFPYSQIASIEPIYRSN